MGRLLNWRDDEVKDVYHQKDLLCILLTMAHKLEEHLTGTPRTQEPPKWNLRVFILPCLFPVTVDVEEMEERQQVDIEAQPLKDFMEVHQVDRVPTDTTGVVTFFQLDEEIIAMAEVLYTLQNSHLFQMCWEKQAKFVADEEWEDDDPEDQDVTDFRATTSVIHDEIYQPAFADYKNIYGHLKSGQITLKDVNQLFDAFKGNYEELTKELNIMSRVDKATDTQWIHSRVQQIEQYHELHLAVASAEIITMVKETLGLQGDFSILETLREVVRTFKLSQI